MPPRLAPLIGRIRWPWISIGRSLAYRLLAESHQCSIGRSLAESHQCSIGRSLATLIGRIPPMLDWTLIGRIRWPWISIGRSLTYRLPILHIAPAYITYPSYLSHHIYSLNPGTPTKWHHIASASLVINNHIRSHFGSRRGGWCLDIFFLISTLFANAAALFNEEKS